MSQSKREQVVSHLRYIRQELREMHQGVMEDGLLPESGEVRGVMAQMEALLELLEGKSGRKAKAESSCALWPAGCQRVIDRFCCICPHPSARATTGFFLESRYL